MDGDWDEVVRVPFPPPGIHAIGTPIKALAFDTVQELLWAGNDYGRVSSFYGTNLQPYTSFKAHSSQDGPVRQLLFNDKGIIVLGSRSVHMALRRGPPIWHIRRDDMTDLRCMSFTSKGTSEILVAGEQDKMFVIDANKGEIVKEIPTEHHYTILRRSRHICAATVSGTIHILDSLSLKLVKSWNAHSAGINDMDSQHDFIVTCGFSMRQQGTKMLDPLVNVFDLKNMTSMAPMPFPAGAAYVRMHPRMLTTSIVVSQIGQMHVVDLMNPNTSNVRQANILNYITNVEIAQSGEAIVLADGNFEIHLWGSRNKIKFTEYPAPVEWYDPVGSTLPMNWDSSTPLSTVGMPYYREALLSAWPPNSVSHIGLGVPPVRFDPQFLATLQDRSWGLYGRNTRGLRRNQAEDTRTSESSQSSLKAPKFLSEKARELAKSPAGTPAPEEAVPIPAEAQRQVLESHKIQAPEMYQGVEIKYSRFGIDDFDFEYFNKTEYSGLQNGISNCYANPLLMIMHYTPPIRNLALRHAATSCVEESCLLCELAYVFDQLDKAEGAPCHATNFLKCLGRHPEAARLGLLQEESPQLLLTNMLQGLTRFLISKMIRDYEAMDQGQAMMQLFRTSAKSTFRCVQCRIEFTKSETTDVNELTYAPLRTTSRNPRTPKITFSQILKLSVEKDPTSKGWCRNCNKYQMMSQRRTITNVPAILMLTTGISAPEQKRLWANPGWLPEEIGIIVDNGQFFCYEGEDLKLHLQRGIHNITVYSLTGLAVNIGPDDGSQKGTHLVAMANVAHSAPEAPGKSQWYMFNDFHVLPVSSTEALTFNTTWKMPSVITYQVKSANNKLDSTWKDNLDSRLLYIDLLPDHVEKTYRTLDEASEKAGPNTIVALDTEFVRTSQQEVEVNSDGDQIIIRPIGHALARTSVVRVGGIDEGLPFIDDYIHIREPIQDYLTQYSGITEADLDPKRSKHNLVTLKIAYKKIWLLLNLGCKFLGHGLKADFRVINIQVPKSQVIDTADLFYLKNRFRKLSLQFLTWYLLKQNIQEDTHDSIEDARSALALYRKYQEFDDAGILETMLLDIYAKGNQTSFKPPAKQGQALQRANTPPVTEATGTASGPSTPAKRTGAAMGSLGTPPTWTPAKGSPLR